MSRGVPPGSSRMNCWNSSPPASMPQMIRSSVGARRMKATFSSWWESWRALPPSRSMAQTWARPVPRRCRMVAPSLEKAGEVALEILVQASGA